MLGFHYPKLYTYLGLAKKKLTIKALIVAIYFNNVVMIAPVFPSETLIAID